MGREGPGAFLWPPTCVGPKESKKTWCRWPPAVVGPRASNAQICTLPPGRPRGPGSFRPPSRPQPRGRWHPLSAHAARPSGRPSLCRPAGPPPPSAGWRAGVAGLPACALEGGSSPAASCPLRAYTPIPPYTRVWVCVRGCAGVHVPVHMHTYATHGLPERARRLFLLRHSTPPYPQHNRCR